MITKCILEWNSNGENLERISHKPTCICNYCMMGVLHLEGYSLIEESNIISYHHKRQNMLTDLIHYLVSCQVTAMEVWWTVLHKL